MREYLLCLLAAAAVTYLTTPLVRKLAIRSGAMAEVRDRDVHDEPTPRWGGLAMFAGLIVGLILASQLPLMRDVFVTDSQPLALMVGCTIIVMLGLADDKWGLDAPTKFVGQVLAAGSMALVGIQVLWLPIAGTLLLDPLASVLLTVLIVVLTVNAVNFVDGLDGLVAGVAIIANAAFFIYTQLLTAQTGADSSITLAALIAATIVGISAGFLPFNWHRARMFMGDAGSMLLGLLLSCSSLSFTGQMDSQSLNPEGTGMLPYWLPLVLPAWETMACSMAARPPANTSIPSQ